MLFFLLITTLIVAPSLCLWYLWEARHRKTRAMTGGLHKEISLPHEQPWELYHNNLSLCSKKIRVCLNELGIDYKAHHIDLIETGSYQTLSRDFLHVNPAASVPVLVHNGHPVYESHDQLIYAAAHSDTPNALVPDEEEKRQLMNHWVHKSSVIGDDPVAAPQLTAGNAVPGLTLPLFATMIETIPTRNILEGLLFHRIKKRALFFLILKLKGARNLPKPVVTVINDSRAAMHTHLDELETVLKKHQGDWVVGEQFTLADVGMMVIFERLKEADWLEVFVTDNRPKVKAYWQALQARTSYQSAIADFDHPTVSRGTERIIELKGAHESFRAPYASAP
jgi:glutathione S-transferase